MTTHSGSCFCGAVQYELADAPMFVQCCHCTDCQTQSGAPFVINGQIEAEKVTLTKGTPVRVTMPTDSGRPHDIYRCETCQTALWSDYGRREILLFIRMQTLKDKLAIKPDAHIFTRSKLPWLDLPKDMRAFEVYYDLKKEWTSEALKRREAMLAKIKK